MRHSDSARRLLVTVSAAAAFGLAAICESVHAKTGGVVSNATAEPEVIDLSANPKDLSPAVHRITAEARMARAAGKKVVIILGEEHTSVPHVRMPELLRQSFKYSGIGNPVVAVEQQNNLAEYLVPRYFPGDERNRVLQALGDLKNSDPARYHRLQALAHATLDWPEAPLTKLENFMSWIADGVDVRLVDMGRVKNDDFSYLDAGQNGGTEGVRADSIEALHLRNVWIATELWDILRNNDIVILETGLNHLSGDPYQRPYEHSLHAIFNRAASDDVKVITVFQEKTNFLAPFGNKMDARYEYLVSAEARAAVGVSGALILRGSDEARHDQSWEAGDFGEEAAALADIARASQSPGAMPRIGNKDQYQRQLQRNKDALKAEFDALIPVPR
ncbi:MAG: hypothetical protein AAB036_04965 [Elusimicrobiota bacterium]